MRRRRWWAPDTRRRINLVDVTAEAAPNALRLRVQARYIIVAIVAAKNLLQPTPPLRFDFFDGDGAPDEGADPDAPIEPIYSVETYLGEMPTDDGPVTTWGYLYVVPVPSPYRRVYMDAHDGVPTSFASTAALGIVNLAELGTIGGATLTTFAPTQTMPAATDGVADLNGLWLLSALTIGDRTSGDTTVVGWPGEQLGQLGGSNTGGEPGFILGDVGATSGPDLEFTFAPDGGVLGVWIQLLPTPVPAVVELPLTTTVTATSSATTERVVGATMGVPPVVATAESHAAAVLPSASTAWRAVLVNALGTTVARMPRAVIGEIVETLNDIDTAQLTIEIRSRAGELIDEAVVLPELEVQIWRGDVLWLWGPIVDAVPEGDHWRLEVRDFRWHLTRRHVGELGGTFGGKPPYYHDELLNQRFESGDIGGWAVLRTVSIGEFVGFGAPDLSAIVADPSRLMGDGNPMVRCTAPTDPLDNYQLFQDIAIRGPQNGRALQVTLSGWWYLPSDGGFAPNNQRMGLLLAALLPDASLPADYYRPADVKFTTLDASSPRDEVFYQECTLTMPQGVSTLVHVAVCFPQGVSFIGGIDLQVDDGLLYNESPSTIGPGLVMHAQDPAFAKSDVNIDWTANTIGDQVIREYKFNDHTNIASAIATLAGEGWFDWFPSYSETQRWATFTAPRRGGYRPACRIRMNADGRGNVDSLKRQRIWSSGATVVAAQTRSEGNHERAARSGYELTLEEVFVAPREPKDYDLGRLAAEHLAPAIDATVVEVESRPGDERYLLDTQTGDTTDLLSTMPGHRVSGRHRLVRRTIMPARDATKLTWNPEP